MLNKGPFACTLKKSCQYDYRKMNVSLSVSVSSRAAVARYVAPIGSKL